MRVMSGKSCSVTVQAAGSSAMRLPGAANPADADEKLIAFGRGEIHEQPFPDRLNDVGTGEECVQARAFERLPLGICHQGARALPAFHPDPLVRPIGAEPKCGLKGGVPEAAEACQHGLVVRRGRTTFRLEVIEHLGRGDVGLEAFSGAGETQQLLPGQVAPASPDEAPEMTIVYELSLIDGTWKVTNG